MNTQRVLQVYLRAVGALMGLAVVAAFMPRSWMDWCHQRLGLGPFPDGPIVEYLARSLSAFYAFFGALLWVLAGDVRRYERLITWVAGLSVAFAGMMYGIDLRAGMPPYWTAAEGTIVLAMSLVILVLQARCKNDKDIYHREHREQETRQLNHKGHKDH